MTGKRIGYIRVSTADQNPDRQLEGVTLHKRFIDHCSGKSMDRPQLQLMLDYVRDGDIVIVHSMDRLARNLSHLHQMVDQLTQQEVTIQFLKEGLTFTGEDSPMAKLLLSVMGAVSEFERSLIRERQFEGIALAKQRGAYKGRKPSLNQAQVKEIEKRLKQGDKKSVIAREYGIRRETLHQYLKKQYSSFI